MLISIHGWLLVGKQWGTGNVSEADTIQLNIAFINNIFAICTTHVGSSSNDIKPVSVYSLNQYSFNVCSTSYRCGFKWLAAGR